MTERQRFLRWMAGHEAAAARSRTTSSTDVASAVALSIELMEIAWHVERTPAARRRRELEEAQVRTLWRRVVAASRRPAPRVSSSPSKP